MVEKNKECGGRGTSKGRVGVGRRRRGRPTNGTFSESSGGRWRVNDGGGSGCSFVESFMGYFHDDREPQTEFTMTKIFKFYL